MKFIMLTEAGSRNKIIIRKKDIRRVVEGDDEGALITFSGMKPAMLATESIAAVLRLLSES